ncbi:MAG: ComF family protein [Myxococcota bacterium]
MVDDSSVLARLLFPPVCLGCGLLLRPDAPPQLPLCRRCGLEHEPLPPTARVHDEIWAVHAYGGPLLRALTRLKFQHQAAWAGPLGSLLAGSPVFDPTRWDALVPIPLHPRRQRERGFNQATLLARHARRRGARIPLRPRWLRRVRATAPQHRLPSPARRHNLDQAFVAPRPARVAGRRVLLIDDVTTTGATFIAARQALLAAGAQAVGALALLRTLA